MANLSKEDMERIKKAQEAIDAVCDEYRVALVPQLMIVQGNIVNHTIGIMPQREESRIIKPQMRKEVEKNIVQNPRGK